MTCKYEGHSSHVALPWVLELCPFLKCLFTTEKNVCVFVLFDSCHIIFKKPTTHDQHETIKLEMFILLFTQTRRSM